MKVSYGLHSSKVRKNMSYIVEICLLTFLVLKYRILVYFVKGPGLHLCEVKVT